MEQDKNLATENKVFELLKASLFTDENIDLLDWEDCFLEMKSQAVAALPGEWLKKHLKSPEVSPWLNYCVKQQGRWIRIMYEQQALINLLEENNIPCVIIKGAAVAVYYPHPSLRLMGDVDFLVSRNNFDKAATILESNGYLITNEKHPEYHHYGYSKNGVFFELHRKLGIIENRNETLLTLFENGICNREWINTEGYRFPVLSPVLTGLVLIFHINQHLREGIGLRQIIDFMMYINQLPSNQWENLLSLLRPTGLEKLTFTVVALCQKYLGLKDIVNEDFLPVEDLKEYIMKKGNFGRKAGIYGKAEAFLLSSTEKGGFFKRLQKGGIDQWGLAKKHHIFRPFAWIYQGCRLLGILTQNHVIPKELRAQHKNSINQRRLIESLGLKMNRFI